MKNTFKILSFLIIGLFVFSCQSMSPEEKQAREDLKKIYNSETGGHEKIVIVKNLIDILEAKGGNKSKDDEKLILELMEKKLNFEKDIEKIEKDREERIQDMQDKKERIKARLK